MRIDRVILPHVKLFSSALRFPKTGLLRTRRMGGRSVSLGQIKDAVGVQVEGNLLQVREGDPDLVPEAQDGA